MVGCPLRVDRIDPGALGGRGPVGYHGRGVSDGKNRTPFSRQVGTTRRTGSRPRPAR